MVFTNQDAIEFYFLTDEARFVLGGICRSRGYAVSGNTFTELENAGFITVDYEDECRLELTEKGHRVISLLAPEDLDHNLQNLKLQAKALKEEQRVSKVNQDDAGNLSIR